MNALEELGLCYDDVGVNIRTLCQKTPEYLAINANGNVPTIVLDGHVMTENAAILWFLHMRHPEAALLPPQEDSLQAHQGLSDLIWFSCTIHPIVRQIRMPAKWTSGDPQGVRADGIEKLTQECIKMSERVAQGWWYGSSWTIVDTYLYWAVSTAQRGGFPLDQYPILIAHGQRVRARSSFARVLAREQAALDAMGITDITL